MQVSIKTTAENAYELAIAFVNESFGYYAYQPYDKSGAYIDGKRVSFNFDKDGWIDGNDAKSVILDSFYNCHEVAWITSNGNTTTIDLVKNVVTYVGRRHGMREAIRTIRFDAHTVLYCVSESDAQWFETDVEPRFESDFAEKVMEYDDIDIGYAKFERI